MEIKYPRLFSPYKIHNLTFKNRLINAHVGAQVIPVGDCVRPATVMEASSTGYYAALDI